MPTASERPFRLVLANRQFRLLWTGQAVSIFGDAVLSLALPLIVLDAHGSASQLGFVTAARMLPIVVLLLVGGVVTDRVSRRLAMLVADAARGAVTLGLGLLLVAGSLRFFELLVGAALLGTFDALFAPASTALLPELVEPRLLTTANSLTQLSRSLAPLLGPVVAAVVAPSVAMFVDAASFAVSAGFLVAMSPTPKPPASARSALAQAREGLSFCRRTPWIWWTLLVASLANAAVFVPSSILVVLLVVRVLHQPRVDLGFIFAGGSLGATAGALVAGRFGAPRHRIRWMYLVWAGAGVVAGAIGLARSAWLVGLLYFLVSPLLVYGTVIWEAMLQSEVPRQLLGRVSSVDWLVSLVVTPVGVAAAGAVAQRIGPRPTIAVPGFVAAAIGIGVLLVVRSVTAVDRVAAGASSDHADGPTGDGAQDAAGPSRDPTIT